MLATAIGSPAVVGASVAGPSHRARGDGCQDAFATESLPDGSVVIAVADGLGSARHALVGAQAGVATAVRAARALAEAAPDLPLPQAVAHAVACARLGIVLAAGDAPARDHACTLIVVVASERGTCAAHVGDGAVVVQTEGLAVLSGPGPSEYVEVTDTLTAPDWRRRLRVSPVVAGVRALAVLTDGCQRAGLRADGSPGAAFFDPLFEHVRLTEPGSARADLHAVLSGQKLSEHSDDDKTLVLAILGA